MPASAVDLYWNLYVYEKTNCYFSVVNAAIIAVVAAIAAELDVFVTVASTVDQRAGIQAF